VRLALALLLAALLAGCGSSSQRTTGHLLPPPCAPKARAVLGQAQFQPFTASNLADGCRLQAGRVSAVVLLDSAPQPYTRMEREVTEFGQNVDWTKVPPSAYPRTIKHLGLDANWFPLQSRLLTTDGVRLITIKLHGELEPPAKRELAARLARVYLGPLRKPPGY
jgi:hypothetical protein